MEHVQSRSALSNKEAKVFDSEQFPANIELSFPKMLPG